MTLESKLTIRELAKAYWKTELASSSEKFVDAHQAQRIVDKLKALGLPRDSNVACDIVDDAIEAAKKALGTQDPERIVFYDEVLYSNYYPPYFDIRAGAVPEFRAQRDRVKQLEAEANDSLTSSVEKQVALAEAREKLQAMRIAMANVHAALAIAHDLELDMS